MKKLPRLKRIIAREGLIVLALIAAGALWEVLSVTWFNTRLSGSSSIRYLYDLPAIADKAVLFLIFAYPLYLAARFFLWAIKTLRLSEDAKEQHPEEQHPEEQHQSLRERTRGELQRGRANAAHDEPHA